MFANMFFVFIATMVLSLMVSSGNENNLTTQALIIGGVYATILFVFQSA